MMRGKNKYFLLKVKLLFQVQKHRLIQYLFLDLASCLTNNSDNESNSSIVESLIKFPSAFGMPPSVIKLTQAFWLVDHEDFDEVQISFFLLILWLK